MEGTTQWWGLGVALYAQALLGAGAQAQCSSKLLSKAGLDFSVHKCVLPASVISSTVRYKRVRQQIGGSGPGGRVK